MRGGEAKSSRENTSIIPPAKTPPYHPAGRYGDISALSHTSEKGVKSTRAPASAKATERCGMRSETLPTLTKGHEQFVERALPDKANSSPTSFLQEVYTAFEPVQDGFMPAPRK
jgi:hypothetical protein